MASFALSKSLVLLQLLFLVSIGACLFPTSSANLFEDLKFVIPRRAPAPAPHPGLHPGWGPLPPPAHPPRGAHPPGHPPKKPPVHPPKKPPVHPPAKPPVVLPHPPLKPPVHPPVKPPVHPPASPPTALPPPPPKPASPPPRAYVLVQGIVSCFNPKYWKPIKGAVVKLVCKNTKYNFVKTAKTDKNGYYLIPAPTVSTYAAHKCRVFLVSSPQGTCKKPGKAGTTGAILKNPKYSKVGGKWYALYTVDPLTFQPK